MILSILKIIGIILLVIIALVIALLLLVLLWPVTYKASADLKPEVKKGGATVSWLFGALKLRLTFDSSLEKPDESLCDTYYNAFKRLHDDEISRLKENDDKKLSSFGIA